MNIVNGPEWLRWDDFGCLCYWLNEIWKVIRRMFEGMQAARWDQTTTEHITKTQIYDQFEPQRLAAVTHKKLCCYNVYIYLCLCAHECLLMQRLVKVFMQTPFSFQLCSFLPSITTENMNIHDSTTDLPYYIILAIIFLLEQNFLTCLNPVFYVKWNETVFDQRSLSFSLHTPTFPQWYNKAVLQNRE